MIAMLRRTPLGLTSLIFAATFLIVLPTAVAASRRWDHGVDCPATGLGELRAVARKHQRHSHRALRHRVSARRLQQAGRRPGSTCRHQGPCHRSAHRFADDQPRWSGPVGGRRRGRNGCLLRGQRHNAALRPCGLRPARCRPFHARGAVPHRRRIRRVPARSVGRLQPRRGGPHRGHLSPICRGMPEQGRSRIPGQRRHRQRRARHGRRPPGTG